MTKTPKALRSIDVRALAKDLNALRDELKQDMGQEDLTHLKRMMRWGRACSVAGYATAWLAPNPISAWLIAQGNFTRWAMIGHHVIHRGYDKIPDVPKHLTSKGFAKGWRRFTEWFDWMDPEAWNQEHNFLHHYKLGEEHDPDQPEENLEFLRDSPIPQLLRYPVVAFFAMTWKPLYYAPNTILELRKVRQRRDKQPVEKFWLFDWRVWQPFVNPGREIWLKCWGPYILFYFVALPLLFLPLGPWFAASMFINRLMAEVIANVYSFLVIVPNHAGDDVYRFDDAIENRDEFYLRQIVGSVNYTCGGDFNDFLHGWLNYQIEHHLWPDLSMRQYQRAHPRVKAICAKHGVPFVQESVFKRAKKLVDVMVGRTSMMWWDTESNTPQDARHIASPPEAAVAAAQPVS